MREEDLDEQVRTAIRLEIAAMRPGTVFGISAFTGLVERISKSDMAFFMARTALKKMAADGEILDIGGELFVTLDNGKPPAAADVVQSYGEKAGYPVFADDEASDYRTGGPSMVFKIGDREIILEHDPSLAIKLVIGSGNFLKDRGYPNPEATREKFEVINEIELAIEEREMTVGQVEEFTGIPIPVLDARWIAALLKKDISELEDIRDRIRTLPLPGR